MNTALAGTNKITVEGWCYLTNYPFLPTIAGNYQSGTMQFLLRIDANRTAFWVDPGTGFRVINGATTIPLNTWTHLAGVWDGSQLRVYVNGVLDGTTPGVSGGFLASANPVRIGASLTSEAFTGKIDGVRIWTIARTGLQISGTMNTCTVGAPGGLLAAYNFEEGAGSSTADVTGHGYNGTLMGSSIPGWSTGFACSGLLPVNFLSISASKTNAGVELDWKVAGEKEILQYEIERSTDGTLFNTVGTVPANRGTSYSWIDQSPVSSASFYRIKSVELSGTIKYSSVVRLPARNEKSTILVSPNPIKGNDLNLQFKNQEKGKYTIQLSDAMGRILLAATVQHPGGSSNQTIELPASARNGIYQLTISGTGKRSYTQKLFIKQ